MTREMYVCLYTCDCERHTSLVSSRDIRVIARHTHRVNVYIWRDPPLCYTSHRKRYLSFRDIHMIAKHTHRTNVVRCLCFTFVRMCIHFWRYPERWGAGVETQKNVRGEIGGWGRVPFYETFDVCVLHSCLCFTNQTWNECKTQTSNQIQIYLERSAPVLYVSLRDTRRACR